MGLSKHLLIIIVLAVFVGAVAAQTSPNLISGSSQIKDFSKYYGFVKIDYWSMKANAQVSHIVALRRSDYYSSYSLWIAQDQSFPLDPSFTDTVHNKVTLSYLDSQGNPTTKFNFEFVKGGNGALGVKITDPNGNSCYSAKSGADQLGYIYNLQAEPSVRQTIYFLPPPIQSGKSTNKEYYGDKCGVKVRLSDETVSDFLFDEGLLDTAAKQFNVRLVLKSKPTEAYVDSFLSDPNYYAKHFLWSVLPRNSLGGNPKALNVNTIDPLVDNRTVSVTIGGKSGTFEFKQQAGATPHIKLFLDGHECTSSKQETQKDAEGYYGPDTSVSGGKEYYWNECGLKLVVNFVSGNTYSLSQLMLDDASLPSYFLAYSAPSPVAPPVVNPNALSVQVIQDGKVVAPQNGTITVDRKPFVLRFGAPASSSNVTFYFNVKNSRLLAVNAGTSISDISARVNSNSVASDYYFPLNDDRFLEADIYGTQSTACSLKTDAPYKACEIQVKGIVDSTGTQVELANSKAASLDFVIVQDTDKDGKLSAAEIVPVSVSFSSQPQCSSFLECLARIDLGFVKNLLALLNPVATK